jgi:hypothetical protein
MAWMLSASSLKARGAMVAKEEKVLTRRMVLMEEREVMPEM